ncbi:hypothetical protein [Saccharopolyspora sp. NPDC050642]|uniref:hypothetical protein n=1 Tax=Saccharopolyspora sp. NPDC050642 TaxID=3157099 RepID=UPI0033F49B90
MPPSSPCRRQAVAQHGARLAELLSEITYDHRGIRLSWAGPDTDPTAFTPRVRFTTADVHDPHGPPVCFGWFEDHADDQLIAACTAGADDWTVLGMAVAQAHYAVATLAVHEVGEWFTYQGRQVFPPHRPDPYLCRAMRTAARTATGRSCCGSPTTSQHRYGGPHRRLPVPPGGWNVL